VRNVCRLKTHNCDFRCNPTGFLQTALSKAPR
jgi:hypothetical protein